MGLRWGGGYSEKVRQYSAGAGVGGGGARVGLWRTRCYSMLKQ